MEADTKRTVYVNGAFCGPGEAKVSIFDRGLTFADGVYEVLAVMDGKLIDFAGHMARLRRSLGELAIEPPLSEQDILDVVRELVERNGLVEGLLYMQVNRGVAERDFVFSDDLEPTVFMFTQEKPLVENQAAQEGIKLKSVPDIRWARRDIKTIMLLAQVLAKQEARKVGAYEALLVKDGYVTECGSSSAFIIKDNVVATHPLGHDILPGITRASLVALAAERGIALDERRFTLEEAYAADEAFITAASSYVLPVVAIDDRPVGSGEVGPVVRRLQQVYIEHARATAI